MSKHVSGVFWPCILLCSLILAADAAGPALGDVPGVKDYVPGELLVKFKDGAAGRLNGGAETARFNVHAAVGAELKWRFRTIPWDAVTVPVGADLRDVARAYLAHPAVARVEPNYRVYVADTIPDDPQYGNLWGMERIGAPAAWDVTTGDSNMVVAVIDTGIRNTHEDLAGNIWSNPDETPNGQDDSGNGYVDDLWGWNFVDDNNDPFDDHGHGTHVAGTIGAVGNNGVGVAGVNWEVRLVAVKFLDASGSGTTLNAIRAVEYVNSLAAHVRISNNSWGGGGYSLALEEAIEAAGLANQLFVAAAGNNASDNDENPFYPASYDLDNVISVASIAQGGGLSSFSCFGAQSVHIAAPGSDILSTEADSDVAYGTKSGTSMAAPHVAGAAALIWSRNLAATYTDVRDAILESAAPNAALVGRVATDGELDLPAAMAALGGILSLDRQAYRSDATVQVTVADASVDEAEIEVTVAWRTTDSNGVVRAQDNLSLPRTAEPFRFAAGLQLLTGVNAVHGDTLRVEYVDAGGETHAVEVPIDDVPPGIFNLRVEELTDERFVVRWSTDEPAIGGAAADVQVPPSLYERAQNAFVTEHEIVFSGLVPLTRHYIAVWSEDPAGNRTDVPADTASSDPEDYLTVMTRGRASLYRTDFERGAAGWTTTRLFGEDCWEYGTPQFGPYPASRCWGTRINGRYPNVTHALLTSPRVKVGANPVVSFVHWRDMQLTSDHYWWIPGPEDYGAVEVFADGVWHNVTRYSDRFPNRNTFSRASDGWEAVRIVLPDSFAHRTIQVRFRFLSDEHTIGKGNPAGWYIDSFEVGELVLDGVLISAVGVRDDPPGGDGDGFLEPGETADIRLTVHNFTDGALTNLHGNLTALSDGSPAQDAVLNGGTPALIPYGTVAVEDSATSDWIPLEIGQRFNPEAVLTLFQRLTAGGDRHYETLFNMDIRPRVAIAGHVYDIADDAPIEGAAVVARRGSARWETQTQADGTFSLGGLSPDTVYAVSASKTGEYASVSANIRAPATGVAFGLGRAALALDPDYLHLQVVQGGTVDAQVTIANTNGSLPLVYEVHALSSDDWLRVDEPRGTLPPGGSRTLGLTADARMIPSGNHVGFLWVESNDSTDGFPFVIVDLDVLERPWPAFASVRLESAGEGWLTPGQPGDLWVVLRNTNGLSTASGLTGTLTPRDPGQAAVSPPGTLNWPVIPAGGTATSSAPAEVTLDPGLTDGEEVLFDLEVIDGQGTVHDLWFAITHYGRHTVSGLVSCVSGPAALLGPVSNALITAATPDGVEAGRALSDSNGVYRIAGLRSVDHWLRVTPPANSLLVARVPGTNVLMNAAREVHFELRHDGSPSPFLALDAVAVDDGEHGNGDGVLDPGERLVVRTRIRNLGSAAAVSVTGTLQRAEMGVPAVMTVVQGTAGNAINIVPGGPAHALLPAFEVEIDPHAPKGRVQRFLLSVTDTASSPPRNWSFDLGLQVDPRVAVTGTVHFAGGDNSPQNMAATRVRLQIGGFVRTVAPAPDGAYRFFDVPRGERGSLAVVAVPAGYELPAATAAIPALDGDYEVAPIEIPRWDAVSVSPADLAFVLLEGQSTNGLLTVANTGAVARTFNVRVRHRRGLDEVRVPEPEKTEVLEAEEPVETRELEPVLWEQLDAEAHQDDEVVVRFAAGVSRDEQLAVLNEHGLDPVFFFNSFPAALARRTAGPAPLGEWSLAAADIEADGRVVQVAPDARAERYATLPDDPFFEELYGLYNRRQTGGSLGADIRAPRAWDHTTGSREIVVAICDTGIMTGHEDLKGNIWVNPRPGTSAGIENDWNGWNFFHNNNDVEDGNGHGTHVAGTVGAVGDNGVGVAGVNWKVSLMAVRLADAWGRFTTSARIAKAIEYAAENGAHISNHSWGGPDTAGVIYDALVFARANNHLVVAAAGNSAQNLDNIKTYPAYYSTVFDNVITVAASDHDGELAWFTSFGEESVNLAAPGVDILSTIPDLWALAETPSAYARMGGTSMAAPHVSGVAALLWSLAPEAPYTVIREAILKGVRVDPNLEGWVSSSGHLDAWGAIRAMGAQWLQAEPAAFTLNPGQATNLTLTVNDPPQLVARLEPYAAEIVVSEGDAFSRVAPVTATVQPGVWLAVQALRVENLEGYADDLAASPGDNVELWVTLRNRGSGFAMNLEGALSGGAGSVIHQGVTGWGSLYGQEAAEAAAPLLVRLDPAAAGDVVFQLAVTRNGQPAGVYALTVPVLPGRKAAGTIRTPTGVAVPGARVECRGARGVHTLSDANGGFLLRGLPDGDYTLRAIPVQHERSAETAFSVGGADANLGTITVRAPAVEFSAGRIDATLLQGGSTRVLLSISNHPGPAQGVFDYTLHVAPRRRVGLVSDGITLGALKSPLEEMGFDVSRITNNFDRVQRFNPENNAHWLEQQVRHTWDQSRLAEFDAVIFDMSGPRGHGRLLQEDELEALADYVARGGKVIFTGANPLSSPDNHEMAAMAAIVGLDRAATPTNQAWAVETFSSPFLTLGAGDRMRARNLEYDLAPTVQGGARPLFRAGEANKLLSRSIGDGGAVYVWTGNPGGADWAGQGLWQDVLRGILWRELIEGAAGEVSWLQTNTGGGTIGVGGHHEIELTLDAAYPAVDEMRRASLLVLGNYPGADVRAVRVNLDVRPPRVRAFTTGSVTDWRGVPLRGDGSDASSLFQVVWAGPDGVIDPPLPNGSPGGDDRLLSVFTTGLSYGRFGVGFETAPDSGRFDQRFRHAIPSGETQTRVYVRAWDGSTYESSLAYGDSAVRSLAMTPDEEHDFGSWTVDRILRYGRDTSGDSIPDGWLMENRPDLDPAAPVLPLASAANYAGKVNLPSSGSVVPDPRKIVVAQNFIFVLDTANNRLAIVGREAPHALTFYGTQGGGAGEFRQPKGLALDPRAGQYRLAVADTGNHRIVLLGFDPALGTVTHLSAFGERGATDAKFEFPAGVSVIPVTGDIFVADTGNHRIQAFTAAGTYRWKFAGSGDYLMKGPRGIAVDTDYGVWVADTGNHRVLQFNHMGTPIRKFGAQGSGDGQFLQPEDVRVWHHTRPDGTTVRRLCVTDHLNSRVQLFLPDGTHLLNVGSHGGENGKLRTPYGAFPVTDTDLLYVADTGNERIQWYTVLLDADGDGMDDFWEDRNGLDSTRNDAFEDADNDGLLNIGEFRARTNPLDRDTNGNGVGDLLHLYYGYDPTDPDVVIDPNVVANLVSLTPGVFNVDAGDPVTITAVFDRALPAGTAVALTLTGASPLGRTGMFSSDETVFVYTHQTLPGENGFVHGGLFCGAVEPPDYAVANLFRVLAPLVPFRITGFGGHPPQLSWDAQVGRHYRIERALKLTDDPVQWQVLDTLEAVGPFMSYTIPTNAPEAFFRVVADP